MHNNHSCSDTYSSRLRKVLKRATYVNATFGVGGLAVGVGADSSAVFADGMHNTADTFSHAMHTSTHKAEDNNAQQSNANNEGRPKYKNVGMRRRLAACAIAAGALIAGYEASQSVEAAQDGVLNKTALGFELATLAMNAYFLRKVITLDDGSHAAIDARNHHFTDTVVSSVATAGIIANPATGWSDGVAGYFAASATALMSVEIFMNSYGKQGPLHTLYSAVERNSTDT